ncbi:MAG: M20/M25/M40 family metallo-hydrolase [Anaerolineaceae bacterium]|nr:M20/M25/M40 family metallo-hydrolase [Anaerolineaceae bacterium]
MTGQSQDGSQLLKTDADQINLLEKLSNACAVSGDEGEVRTIVLEALKSARAEVRVDALGNVLAVCKAAGENPLRVLLTAHMDEIGFMLTDKEDGGLFRFDLVGGIDARYLPGKPVWVGKNRVPGVIGAKPIHLTTQDERKKTISLDNLRIDLGPAGSELAKVGDRAAFATAFQQAGPSLMGKALDDRLGVAALIELVRHAPAHIELQAAFTVQEEVGARGARVAAYTLNPDVAFAIDSTPAHDLPGWDETENAHYNSRLGGGPAIYIADSGTISDPRLVQFLVQTAEKHHLPYQFRQPGAGGTDASQIHKQRQGIPSVSVSTPGRYAHTPVMIARLEDWQNTLALLQAALQAISPDILTTSR